MPRTDIDIAVSVIPAKEGFAASAIIEGPRVGKTTWTVLEEPGRSPDAVHFNLLEGIRRELGGRDFPSVKAALDYAIMSVRSREQCLDLMRQAVPVPKFPLAWVVPNVVPLTGPWGRVQTCTDYGEGVYLVTTASHGGFQLSQEAHERMPEALRGTSREYEEDERWSLVSLAFPHLFSDVDVYNAETTASRSFPDEYAAFKKTILPTTAAWATAPGASI